MNHFYLRNSHCFVEPCNDGIRNCTIGLWNDSKAAESVGRQNVPTS